MREVREKLRKTSAASRFAKNRQQEAAAAAPGQSKDESGDATTNDIENPAAPVLKQDSVRTNVADRQVPCDLLYCVKFNSHV
jgi:hypothetical protein